MPKRKSTKKKYFLEAVFNHISVCQKDSFKPFMEAFIHKPENVSQQKLGTLAGIFEITDTSQDSSYIVNYLASIIKKEYYRQTKRGTIESFEIALHKANLALAKLAEHGNIEWIGKLNSVVLVIEKNNLYLSQTGKARALFLRGKSFADINKDISPSENPNPLKTFVDLTSGRLKKNDKIVITTDNLFQVLPFKELKQNILKFSSPKFIQFLKTVSVNKLGHADSLVVEMQEKMKEIPPITRKKMPSNVFSQTAFSETLPHTLPSSRKNKVIKSTSAQEKQTLAENIKKETKKVKKEKEEFVDKKTGDIYIKEKEDELLPEKNSFLSNLTEFLDNARFKLTKFLLSFSKKWTAIFYLVRSVKLSSLKLKFPFKKNFLEADKIKKIKNLSAKISSKNKETIVKSISPTLKILKNSFFSWLSHFFLKIRAIFSKLFLGTQKNFSHLFRKTEFKSKGQKIFFNVLPRPSKIKHIFLNLSYPQKIYASLTIILLFVIPYFMVKINHFNQPKTISPAKKNIFISSPLSSDKNVVRLDNLSSVYTGKNIKSVINLNNHFFAVDSTEIINLAKKKKYLLPNDFGKTILACPMDNLNLIFILNNHHSILSWSPVSKKFKSNQINLPPNSNITSIKTYLTYLYILDKKHNQILRYPRATGGFGDKTNWLKEKINLDKVSDMAINEGIFLAYPNNILKFFRGKKQPFQIGKTATTIKIDQLYSHPDSQNIYILDKTNARFIKLDLAGNIVAQYYNKEIKNALNFSIDEKNNLIYFATTSKIWKISI